MPQLSGAGGGGGGDPELCATDEMIPFKDEGDPQKEKIFAEISHPEEEGDLADIKSSLVNESEIIPASNGHEVSGPLPGGRRGVAGPGEEQRRREDAGEPRLTGPEQVPRLLGWGWGELDGPPVNIFPECVPARVCVLVSVGGGVCREGYSKWISSEVR